MRNKREQILGNLFLLDQRSLENIHTTQILRGLAWTPTNQPKKGKYDKEYLDWNAKRMARLCLRSKFGLV